MLVTKLKAWSMILVSTSVFSIQSACKEENGPAASSRVSNEFLCKAKGGWNKGYVLRIDLESGVLKFDDLDRGESKQGRLSNPKGTAEYLVYLLNSLPSDHHSGSLFNDLTEWKMELSYDGQVVTRLLEYSDAEFLATQINDDSIRGPEREFASQSAIRAASAYKNNAYAHLAIEFVKHILKSHLRDAKETKQAEQDVESNR